MREKIKGLTQLTRFRCYYGRYEKEPIKQGEADSVS